MRPVFQPALVNDPFGDPGVFVDCLFERRALLFDLGDIRALAPRKILRLSDVFVSHTHMDHFMGFDWLLRICLGREGKTRLFGPPGFLDQVEHKLAAYTWNLVERYAADFTFEVIEIHPDGRGVRARFRCKGEFRREGQESLSFPGGRLMDEDAFSVRCAFLDHKTPCLAYALEEKQHVNIWKSRLADLGLPPGEWLRDLKHAIVAGLPEDRPFRAWWREAGAMREKVFPLGELKRQVVRLLPGQKIAYVTDAVYTPENAARIVELARAADQLFIEAAFMEKDAGRAGAKFHLTARQAGWLAGCAGVRTVVPFHHSPIYSDQVDSLRRELEEAFASARAQV
jgi:ribonuclease Z